MSIHKIDYDADTEVRMVVYHQNNPAGEHYYFEAHAVNTTKSQVCRIEKPDAQEHHTRSAAKAAAMAWLARYPEAIHQMVELARNTGPAPVSN